MNWKSAIVATLMFVGSATANAEPLGVRHGNPNDLQWQPLPAYGGEESIIYRSADGARVAAAFRERGRNVFTYTFDHFFVVIRGSSLVRVADGETFTLNVGDYAYFPAGAQVEFENSDDFANLSMLVSDDAISY